MTLKLNIKRGKENKVVDDLYRLPIVKLTLSLSSVKINLLELIKQSSDLEDSLKEIISSIKDKKVDVFCTPIYMNN